MSERIPQSATIRVPLLAFLSSDHLSAAAGKTIAITISKNGAAFGNPSAGATNATEIANGWYYVDLSTTDTGTTGPLVVRGAVSGIDDAMIAYNVVAFVDQTGDSYARLGAPAGASISADIAEVEGETDSIIATLGTPAGASVSADIAALPTGNANADALLDRANAIETGLTPRNAMKGISAMLYGIVTGAQTGTEVFRAAVSNSKPRVTITDDSSGNRSAVTTDFT